MRKKSQNTGRGLDQLQSRGVPRLLLVDDNIDLADATSAFLRRAGFEVEIAGTGKQALDISATFLPEVVVCDISLPDISGFDVARELRARPETKDVVFAVHSAMRQSDLGLADSEMQALNVDLFLAKPLSAKQIAMLHDRWKNRKAGHDA